MTLEQIRCFIEVYLSKSIKKAANAQYKSYQAMSQSIKALENEFGVTLFHRTSKGVEPTNAGKEFYHYAILISNNLAALQENMTKYAKPKEYSSTIKISLAEPIMEFYGDKLYTMLSEIFPQIDFDFKIHQIGDEYFDTTQSDIFISLVSERTILERTQLFSSLKNYSNTFIAAFPAYVWVAESSQYKILESLSIQQLKDMECCTLKPGLNRINAQQILYLYGNIRFKEISKIDIKQNLIKNIERGKCYVIDLPINKNQLMYNDLFSNTNTIRIPTDVVLNCYIVYHNKFSNYQAVIANILKTELNPQ